MSAKNDGAHLLKAKEYLQTGQGYHFSDTHDIERAIECYRKAINLSPNWGEAHFWIANAFYQQSRFEESSSSYNRAIELMPDDPRPKIAYGRLLFDLAHYNEAIRWLTMGLAQSPAYGRSDAMNLLADTHAMCGDIDTAIAIWKEVASATPTYPSYEAPIQEALQRLAKNIPPTNHNK